MCWRGPLKHVISLAVQPFITWRQNKSFSSFLSPPSLFVLSSQSLTRGGSSNLIPKQQVWAGTELSSGQVWNQRKWSQHFQSQDNNGNPTGGTAGNALALFPPAVICRCLLTTHDAGNEHCFLCLRGRENICLSRKYVFTLETAFYI